MQGTQDAQAPVKKELAPPGDEAQPKDQQRLNHSTPPAPPPSQEAGAVKTDQIPTATRRPQELTKQDRCDWFLHRGIILRGKETFAQVAMSLLEVRERQLWRAGYHTWADFIRADLTFSKRHVDRLIRAGQIIASLPSPDATPKPASTPGQTPPGEAPGPLYPENESQARELGRIGDDADARSEAFTDAVSLAGGKQPTADEIRKVVDAHLGDTPRDGEGNLVLRESLQPVFRARAKFAKVLQLLISAKAGLKDAIATPGGFAQVEGIHSDTVMKISNARLNLSERIAHVPCPDCTGVCPEQCDRCSFGWLSKRDLKREALGLGDEPAGMGL